jgi:hypothetical protein
MKEIISLRRKGTAFPHCAAAKPQALVSGLLHGLGSYFLCKE